MFTGVYRYKEALTAYQRAAELAPNDAKPRLLAATTLHRSGRDWEALQQCRDVLAIEPTNHGARSLMAEILGDNTGANKVPLHRPRASRVKPAPE